jgi:hypothetical protein
MNYYFYRGRQEAEGRRQEENCPTLVRLPLREDSLPLRYLFPAATIGSKGLRQELQIFNLVALFQEGFESPTKVKPSASCFLPPASFNPNSSLLTPNFLPPPN